MTHEPFKPRVPCHGKLVSEFNNSNSRATPTQLRWRPVEFPQLQTDFIDGLFTVCGAGSSYLRHGYAIHMSVTSYLPAPFLVLCAIIIYSHRIPQMFINKKREDSSETG